MKKILFPTFVLLLLAITTPWFTACGSDDDIEEFTTASSACIISGVTLGNIPCLVHTLTSEGKDSVYVANISGEYYPMTIDHYGGRIFNVDSLPYGTDVAKVTFYQLASSGVLAINMLNKSDSDTLFVATDSTDFTHPRKVTVHALDGLSSRSYMMEVRVHKEYGDSFIWRKVCDPVALLQNVQATAALATDDSLYLFGARGAEHVVCAAALNQPDDWHAKATSRSIVSPTVYNNKFYAVNNGCVIVSEDACTWTALTNAPALATAVVAQPNALTVATTNGFYTSADATSWVLEQADEPMFLPSANVAMAFNYTKADPTFIDVFAVGETTNQTVVWKHNVDLLGGDTYNWNYYPAGNNNNHAAPALKNRQLYAYDNSILMTGCNNEGAHAFYVSQDGGRTWYDNIIPTCDSITTSAITAVDNKHFIWMISPKGELYRGRFNRLGWQK